MGNKQKTYQDPGKFTKNFRGCRKQFHNAHEEADQVEELYRQLGSGKCQRLKNPTVEALDAILCPIVEQGDGGKNREAVLIYYLGHGVEHNN